MHRSRSGIGPVDLKNVSFSPHKVSHDSAEMYNFRPFSESIRFVLSCICKCDWLSHRKTQRNSD